MVLTKGPEYIIPRDKKEKMTFETIVSGLSGQMRENDHTKRALSQKGLHGNFLFWLMGPRTHSYSICGKQGASRAPFVFHNDIIFRVKKNYAENFRDLIAVEASQKYGSVPICFEKSLKFSVQRSS